MKKKIVVFFLVIIIAFQSLAISTTKKAEASLTALIGAGIATGAFAGFASYMIASGYHMQISDMVVYFTNKYYDKVEDHYIAKAGQVSTLEKYEYTTLGFLTGNNPLDDTALQQEMNDLIRANAPAPFMENYLPDPNTPFVVRTAYWEDTATTDQYRLNLSFFDGYRGSTTLNGKPHQYFTPDALTKIFKLTFNDGPFIGKTVYITPMSDVALYQNNSRSGNLYKVVSQDNSVAYGILAPYNGFSFNGSSLTTVYGWTGFSYLKDTFTLGEPFIPVANPVEYIPDSPAADPTKNIKAVAPNWLDLVSGIAKTPQAIIDRMDQDAALQQAILDRLAALEYGQDVPVVAPTYDPITGEILYNQDIPASTDSDRLWGIGNWLRKIYDSVKSIPSSISNLYNKFITFPEDIANKIGALWNDVIVPGINSFWDSTKMAVTEAKDGILAIPGAIGAALDGFWENTLNPFFTDIKDVVVSIPGKIDALWDSTMEIPMEEIDLSKLNFQGFTTKFPFSIPFDYVNLIKQFVRAPIAPDLTIHLDTSYFTINHTIDMQPLAKYIVFLRWFLLIMFIFGLMMLTQRMIKW